MELMILLERSEKHFSRFIELLKKAPVVRIKDVKRLVSHSSYYALIMKRIGRLNLLLKEFNCDFFLAEPYFDVSSKEVFTALRRCEFVEIESKQDYFVVRFKK